MNQLDTSRVHSSFFTTVSRAQARQRSGRAGRECDGECYRLYTEESYFTLEEDSVPEIKV